MSNRIQLRRDTAANWTSVNPLLASGEVGVELVTGKFKIGNGTTVWSALPYSVEAQISADLAAAIAALNLGTASTHAATDFDAAGAASAAQSAAATDATTKANGAQAFAVQRANHTGTQSADTLTDGTTNKAFLATERTKLAGVATGATVNSTDTVLLARANHTGTESADVLTDGTTNKAFLATERTKLTGIAAGATANSSDATLLARANHTGTESADVLTDGTTNKAFLATERTKLTGVAAGATANSTDAQLRDRSTHTGTQPMSTISDAGSAATQPSSAFDPAGAAAAAQTAAQTYADQYAGSAAGTASRPLAATDTTTTNARTPTAHASTHASGGSDAVTLAQTQVTGLATALAGKASLAATTLASGIYFLPISPAAASTSSTLGNGNFRCSPVYLPAMSIARIGADVTAAGSTGCTLRLGIYADSGGTPGTLVLDAGTVAADAIATPEITLGSTLVLTAGVYWIGAALQGAPASQPTVRVIDGRYNMPQGILLPLTSTLPAANAGAAGISAPSVTGALPTNLTGISGAIAGPRLFFKVA